MNPLLEQILEVNGICSAIKDITFAIEKYSKEAHRGELLEFALWQEEQEAAHLAKRCPVPSLY